MISLFHAGWNVVTVVVVVVLPLICASATPEKLARSAASRTFFIAVLWIFADYLR